MKFKKAEIAFVYGSKWKQRYFTKVGDDYFPLGAQWDVAHQKWSAYFVRPGTDWWTAFYPEDNMKRPTGPTCDGCHSVNYNVNTKQVTEWNVGCEKCHGPGNDTTHMHGGGESYSAVIRGEAVERRQGRAEGDCGGKGADRGEL